VGATATLQITVTVNRTTAVTNTATRATTTPVDPNAANDTASSTVTGSTLPGLSSNGVPPLAQMWPGLTALVLLFVVLLTGRKRRGAKRR
jgi:hypothetical protein